MEGLQALLANIHDNMDKFYSHYKQALSNLYTKTNIWLLDYAALFFFSIHIMQPAYSALFMHITPL